MVGGISWVGWTGWTFTVDGWRWGGWSGRIVVHFGWIGVGRYFLWVARGRWRYILGE